MIKGVIHHENISVININAHNKKHKMYWAKTDIIKWRNADNSTTILEISISDFQLWTEKLARQKTGIDRST